MTAHSFRFYNYQHPSLVDFEFYYYQHLSIINKNKNVDVLVCLFTEQTFLIIDIDLFLRETFPELSVRVIHFIIFQGLILKCRLHCAVIKALICFQRKLFLMLLSCPVYYSRINNVIISNVLKLFGFISQGLITSQF